VFEEMSYEKEARREEKRRYEQEQDRLNAVHQQLQEEANSAFIERNRLTDALSRCKEAHAIDKLRAVRRHRGIQRETQRHCKEMLRMCLNIQNDMRVDVQKKEEEIENLESTICKIQKVVDHRSLDFVEQLSVQLKRVIPREDVEKLELFDRTKVSDDDSEFDLLNRLSPLHKVAKEQEDINSFANTAHSSPVRFLSEDKDSLQVVNNFDAMHLKLLDRVSQLQEQYLILKKVHADEQALAQERISDLIVYWKLNERKVFALQEKLILSSIDEVSFA
jgi:hypothetical protein